MARINNLIGYHAELRKNYDLETNVEVPIRLTKAITEINESGIQFKKKENNCIQLIQGETKPKNDFYNEQKIILPQYQYIKTPEFIQEYLLNLNRISSQNLNRLELAEKFCVQSKSFTGRQQLTALHIRFRLYCPTFDNMNKKSKEWYFYWRMQVLSGNYPDCDVNYIYLFIYELLNYTFNEKAAFNLSMLHHIYYSYSERKPSMKGNLLNWICDFCFELGEKELEMEWQLKKRYNCNSMYNILINDVDRLDNLPIYSWNEYINKTTRTKFFESNKNLIYKVFRSSLPILASAYKAEGKDLAEEWFTEDTYGWAPQPLFSRAVIGRNVPERKIVYHDATAKMKETLQNLFRLSENIARRLCGENRLLNVNIKNFPMGLSEELIQNFTEYSKSFKIKNGRLVKIKDKTSSGRSSAITDHPLSFEQVIQVPVFEFDFAKISALSRESEELLEIFADKYPEEAETETDIEQHIISYSLDVSDSFENVIVEDLGGFITELTELEREFLLGFDDQEREVQEAARYLKSKGNMLGAFINKLNEKALKILGDNIVEHEGTILIINEEYKPLIDDIQSH